MMKRLWAGIGVLRSLYRERGACRQAADGRGAANEEWPGSIGCWPLDASREPVYGGFRQRVPRRCADSAWAGIEIDNPSDHNIPRERYLIG